eukprot:3761193-Pleurochrysis_carterae.AAC.11
MSMQNDFTMLVKVVSGVAAGRASQFFIWLYKIKKLCTFRVVPRWRAASPKSIVACRRLMGWRLSGPLLGTVLRTKHLGLPTRYGKGCCEANEVGDAVELGVISYGIIAQLLA